MTMVLSQLSLDTTDEGTSVGKCFENTIEDVKNIAFTTMTEITQEQKAYSAS